MKRGSEVCWRIRALIFRFVPKNVMDWLDGHPLAMWVVLARLQKSTPEVLLEKIRSNLADIAGEDEESAKLLFRFFCARLRL